MKLLSWIFAGLFVYGLLVGKLGAGLIALGMCAVVIYADRVFKVQEERWRKDPRNATTVPCTAHELDEQCCECSGDRL